jgi:hypothetical protein
VVRRGNGEETEGEDSLDKRVRGNWLRREVIERLRWRVWKMGAGVEEEVGIGEDGNLRQNEGGVAIGGSVNAG